MSTNVTLGDRLRKTRLDRKLTQKKVHEIVGVTRNTITAYENGNRIPDAYFLTRFCKAMGVSADYILGLTDTENQEYAEIAKTTGLTQDSITYLRYSNELQKAVVNALLTEEPFVFEDYYEYFDENDEDPVEPNEGIPEDVLRQMDDEQIKRHEEVKRTHILEHLKNDWAEADWYSEMEEFYPESSVASEPMEDAGDPEHESLPTGDITDAENQLSAMRECWERRAEFEKKEKAKSHLISAITSFLLFEKECSLSTSVKKEKLTGAHSISISFGSRKELVFPSKETDELIEFMHIQKVIDALREFKTRFSF